MLALWLVSDARRSYRQRQEVDPEAAPQDHQARRALWWTVGCLTLGAAAQTGPVLTLLEGLHLGWSKVLMHLFGALAAGCLLQLLRLLQGRCARRRRWLRTATAVTAVLIVIPFVLDPPQTAHLFEPTWAAGTHWVASMTLLAWSLAATVNACLREAGQSDSRAAGVGMRLIAVGNAIGLVYVATCLVLLGATVANGTTPAVVHGRGLDVTLQQIAEVVIVTGLVWTSVDHLLHHDRVRPHLVQRLRPVFSAAHRLASSRWERDPFPRLVKEVQRIRPWWSALVKASPDRVHFRKEMAQAPVTTGQARFQEQRMMTEIHDVQRIAAVYVDEGDRAKIRAVATTAGLRPGRYLEAAIWQACVLLGVDRRTRGAPRRHDPLSLPSQNGGTTMPEAAAALSRELPKVNPLRERLLQRLHDSAMLTWKR